MNYVLKRKIPVTCVLAWAQATRKGKSKCCTRSMCIVKRLIPKLCLKSQGIPLISHSHCDLQAEMDPPGGKQPAQTSDGASSSNSSGSTQNGQQHGLLNQQQHVLSTSDAPVVSHFGRLKTVQS